ncbi:Ig-like domain-containing protein, partial [Acidobacteriota bacterium]
WGFTPNGAGLTGIVEDPLNNKDDYQYYQDGLLKELKETESGGRSLTQSLKYNVLGDPWRAGDTFRGLDKYKFEYKPVNKMLDISEDPEGGAVTYDYDGLSRISHVTRKIRYKGDIRDAVTQYKYTPNGQLERIFDDAGNFTQYIYDSKDRLKDIYYPESVGSMHFTYNKNDQINTYTDLNGTLVSNTYDGAGRLRTRTILPGQEVGGSMSETFGYDDLGRLSTAESEDALVTFDYNTAGRLYQETQELKDSEGNVTATYVVGYTYDDNGNLTGLTYPSNIDPSNPGSPQKEVVYTPDELDRIDTITSGGKTIADYDYEGKDKISDKKLFNGTVLMKSKFDDGRRPESLTYKSGGNSLFDVGMTWNLMDMKLSETGPGIDKEYIYDNAWRLREEINKSDKYISDFSEFYLDDDENLEQIRSFKNGNSMVSLKCQHENKRHQLTGVDYSNLVDNKVVEFHVVPSYDKNGNMKSFVHQYKYNYKNQLLEVVTGTGLNVEYRYDALGRRIEKIVSAPGDKEITRYVHAGWRVIEERDDNDVLLKRYTYGNGIDEQVAMEYKTNNGLVTFIPMHDSTGNVIGVADETGKLVEKYSYSVFGMPEFDYDSAPPVIKSVHVIDGMVITGFSEPVNIGTVTNGMKVKHEGTEVAGTIEPGADGKEVKFTPSEPLPAGQMSVEIAETVEDEAGNQMGSSFSNSFMYSETTTIVHDTAPPEVDRIEKSSNDFIVTFSERIDPDITTNSIEIKKADGTVSGSITIENERTFKFTPDEMLAANQEYTLWVNSTIKDLDGKSINQFFHSFVVLPDDFLVYERPDPNSHIYSRIGNNYLFHGREYEPEVGLYYYRHRYYLPRIGRFLQTDPMQYEDSMNLYQAFGMNPVNRTDPFGAQAIHPHDRDPEMQWMSNYKPLTLKNIDNFLTDISTNTQYMVQGGINLVLGGAQWALHQANAFFYSLRGVDYYSYDLVNYQFDFDNSAGIFRTVDTRPSAEKALGMAGLDTVTGLYYWGKSGIMLLNPNLSEEESMAYKKTFFGGIPGVALLAYGGYRFAKSKIFNRVEYPSDSITFKGEVFRYENYQHMDTTWTIHEWNIRAPHRFSEPGKGALYSSLDAWTAFKEARGNPGKWLTVKRAKSRGILDLTDPKMRQKYNVTLTEITADTYNLTQRLGNVIRNQVYKGILAPSAQNPGGVNLVLFDVRMLFNKIR